MTVEGNMSVETNELSHHEKQDDDDMITLEDSECETLPDDDDDEHCSAADHDEIPIAQNHGVDNNAAHGIICEENESYEDLVESSESFNSQSESQQEIERLLQLHYAHDPNEVQDDIPEETMMNIPTVKETESEPLSDSTQTVQQTPTESELLACMRKYWQYDSFRPHQLEVCQALFRGKDCFYMNATGSGKSLVFLLPTMTLADRGEKVCTIVISPLISLMQDQVLNLLKMNIKACMIDETSGPLLRRAALQGLFQFIYFAPEMAMIWRESLASLQQRVKILCCVIDECHCVSEWGIGFRPEYSQLGDLRDYFGARVPLVALTASATKFCEQDVCNSLRLRDPFVIRTTINRSNIKYIVKEKFTFSKGDVVEEIKCFHRQYRLACTPVADSIIAPTTKFPPVLVYVMTKKHAEEVATALCHASDLQGISVAYYHSDVSSDKRADILQAFLSDRVNVVVATTSFGMGE
jgi:superfamily II DNA helicase RecQ